MTKKAKFIIKDKDGKVLEDFYSKNATKCFNKLDKGTPVSISIKENEFAEQYVGPYIVKGLKNEPEEPEPPMPTPEPTPEPEPIPTPEPEPTPEPTPTPEPEPTPEPMPSPAGLVYDSHIHSKLHDNKVRTVEKEGDISAGKLGVECRASGSPKIVVNNDGTFSLICGSGHGRFYLYCLNYDAALEIEFAWWNQVAGQDLSTKLRSRHNEDGDGPNRFGGYGLSVDRSSYDAKREDYHNVHSQAKSGSIPKIGTKEYHKLRFEVKDEGNTVVQRGFLDGNKIMDKIDTSPKAYMTAKASFAQQSYLWIRQNCVGTGEIRIKSLKVFKI